MFVETFREWEAIKWLVSHPELDSQQRSRLELDAAWWVCRRALLETGEILLPHTFHSLCHDIAWAVGEEMWNLLDPDCKLREPA